MYFWRFNQKRGQFTLCVLVSHFYLDSIPILPYTIEYMEEKQLGKKKKSYKVPVILVFVWVLIAVLFGYSLWIDKDIDTNTTPTETAIESLDAEEVARAIEMTEQQKEQARIRDGIRIEHVKSFRTALATYHGDNEKYPEIVADLVPDYLESIPENPSPGGLTYNYTGIGSSPFRYYEFAYKLEVGVENISAGLHVASPDSLTLW